MEPFFTVVIPTRSQPAGTSQLAACLDALRQQTLPKAQFEVVVVDDVFDETTASLVATFARQSLIEGRYLAQPKRSSLAAARNRGGRAARGHYLAFTDDDCLPQLNWLAAAQAMCRRGALVLTGALHQLAPPPPRVNGQTGGYRGYTVPVETTELVSANCIIQKTAFERAGGFEESFDMAGRVDADLQFKLLEIGVPILKCPAAGVLRAYHPTTWYAPLTNERQTRYDALLYKRHPDLFRQRMPRDEKLALRYYLTLASLLTALIATGLTNVPIATVALLGFMVLTAWLAIERWPAGPSTWRGAKAAILTALAIPFISIYWRLYGSLKYRVLYW